MSDLSYDVLIIGTGIAGLSSAAYLAEKGYHVALVTREKKPHYSNTFWAQGGIIHPSEDDCDLVKDIDQASSFTANLEAAEILRVRGGQILNQLLIEKAQAKFERDQAGNLLFTKEAAHSKERILYRGDFTGKEIQISLLNYLNNKERFPNLHILSGRTAIDLLTPLHHGVHLKQRYEKDRVVGAYVFNQQTGDVDKILAKKTILATGGLGSLYLHHTNSRSARGDGHAMARRAGAVLANMEFIQFHPTTYFDRSSHRRFLISEALRGEGGRLINAHGEAFMSKYHPDEELAPRDIVARAIVEESIKTRHECVYLDISHKDPQWIKERFPTIYHHCLKNNLDMTTAAIPVVPAAHYSCGGVKTDLNGKTNLENLYAVGEVACSGLHGANRLASTSLLEGLTWGQLAAEDIEKELSATTVEVYQAQHIRDWVDGAYESDEALIEQDWMTLKQTMWNYVGITRTTSRLRRANAMFRELHDEIQKFYRNAKLHDELIGLRNAVEVSYIVLNASMRNTQSQGCFHRLL